MPGQLILLVGNSGSGKDCLLSFLKNNVEPEMRLFFPRRWITRDQEDQNENYQPISLNDFVIKVETEELFIWWEAYGYLYGIDIIVKDLLESGYNVLINVSRKVVSKIRQRYPLTTVIQVNTSLEIIQQRLVNRARGDKSEVDLRLERAEELHNFNDWDICINNDAGIQITGASFMELVKNIINVPKTLQVI